MSAEEECISSRDAISERATPFQSARRAFCGGETNSERASQSQRRFQGCSASCVVSGLCQRKRVPIPRSQCISMRSAGRAHPARAIMLRRHAS
jgi:hypothetical protein